MDNTKQTSRLLEATNISSLDISSFVSAYINKLVYNILTYVDDNITIGEIKVLNNYTVENELSQEITGIPGAYSCVDADPNTLVKFAVAYSNFEINEFDMLAKEAIVDFLNLNNGLFVVYLSENNLCELSLDVPKQNGNHKIDSNSYKSITVIPISFSYGNINFLLCEDNL